MEKASELERKRKPILASQQVVGTQSPDALALGENDSGVGYELRDNKVSELERKRKLILAAQQVDDIKSLDALALGENDSEDGYEVRDDRNDHLDEYVRMIALGARMLETNRVYTVLMVMKVYMGLSRRHVANIYGCSHESVRQALLRARQIAKSMR